MMMMRGICRAASFWSSRGPSVAVCRRWETTRPDCRLDRVAIGGLRVSTPLLDFVNREALPGTGVTPQQFWGSLERIVADLGPRNKELLLERANMQSHLDKAFNRLQASNHKADRAAALVVSDRDELRKIGYLVDGGGGRRIETENLDEEVSSLAGPQLVVPATNARYVLNAANARWGSLYDAIYGTDVLASRSSGPSDAGDGDGPSPAGAYDQARGERAVASVARLLDEFLPLRRTSHASATSYEVDIAGTLVVHSSDGGVRDRLRDESLFVGYRAANSHPEAFHLLFKHHGLHIELQIDPTHPIGRAHPAGVKDVLVESALSSIIDLEDSVATVDAEDKVVAYRNWLGLMKGELEDTFVKGGETVTRRLEDDRWFLSSAFPQSRNGTTTNPNQDPHDMFKKKTRLVSVRGRSLLLVRNVGLLMTTPAVTDAAGEEIPEGILDAMCSVLCGMHDLQAARAGRKKLSVTRLNSARGSIYVVKPKLHGPREVAFADETFARVEDALGLPRHTVKMGIMDEERRTSVNLLACIGAAKHRVFFINTGFLDRTGDEIRTCTRGGPVVKKADMKGTAWLKAYEELNVSAGLLSGMGGRAQIGKGMWAMPDRMRDMMREKGAHPESGASTAWVPSPTAATLHALHYHAVDVIGEVQQRKLAGATRAFPTEKQEAFERDLLTPPLASSEEVASWTREEIRAELENNLQGIMGYVVRWIDQGVGCSKVPDIHGVGLMEDRATLRISSQHVANWLLHGVCTQEEVEGALVDVAAVVDAQNRGDPDYRPLLLEDGTVNEHRLPVHAARELVFRAHLQPNGYTEPILHLYRIEAKRQNSRLE